MQSETDYIKNLNHFGVLFKEKARDGMNVLRELQLNKVGSSGFFEEVNGFGSTQLPIFLCHIGVRSDIFFTKYLIKVCSKYPLTSFQN